MIILFLERVRNTMLFLYLPLKQNIMLWHLLPNRLFGYVGYSYIWVFLFLITFLCIVTTRILSKYSQLNFSGTHQAYRDKLSFYLSTRHNYITFCSFLFASCKLLYQVTSYFTLWFSSCQTLDASCNHILNLKGILEFFFFL